MSGRTARICSRVSWVRVTTVCHFRRWGLQASTAAMRSVSRGINDPPYNEVIASRNTASAAHVAYRFTGFSDCAMPARLRLIAGVEGINAFG